MLNVSFAQKQNANSANNQFHAHLKKYIQSNVNIVSSDKLKYLLSHAKNDGDISSAYLFFGRSTYLEGDYITSIKYNKKALFYSKIAKIDPNYADALLGLMISYRRAGLISESEAYMDSIDLFKEHFPSKIQKQGMLYTVMKKYDIDENFCKAAETREELFKLVEFENKQTETGISYLFALSSQLAYVQIKCGQFAKAVESIALSDTYLNKVKNRDSVYMKEFYYMNKALFCVKEKKSNEAKIYFDSASMYVQRDKGILLKKTIYSERLNAEIDDVDNTLYYLKALNALVNKETTITKKIISSELSKKQHIILNKQRNVNLLLIAFFILVLVLIVLFILNKKHQKKIKEKYQKIIADLTQPTIHVNENKIEDPSLPIKMGVSITNDKELEILKNLEHFERKKLFTTKGLSATQMAVMLKTNTKYLSVVLKNHRTHDFYNYINEERINYIVKLLYENPKYLNYKIAVLSDMCGYTTHSQFASAFKSIKGISPSQFVKLLAETKEGVPKTNILDN